MEQYEAEELQAWIDGCEADMGIVQDAVASLLKEAREWRRAYRALANHDLIQPEDKF